MLGRLDGAAARRVAGRAAGSSTFASGSVLPALAGAAVHAPRQQAPAPGLHTAASGRTVAAERTVVCRATSKGGDNKDANLPSGSVGIGAGGYIPSIDMIVETSTHTPERFNTSSGKVEAVQEDQAEVRHLPPCIRGFHAARGSPAERASCGPASEGTGRDMFVISSARHMLGAPCWGSRQSGRWQEPCSSTASSAARWGTARHAAQRCCRRRPSNAGQLLRQRRASLLSAEEAATGADSAQITVTASVSAVRLRRCRAWPGGSTWQRKLKLCIRHSSSVAPTPALPPAQPARRAGLGLLLRPS